MIDGLFSLVVLTLWYLRGVAKDATLRPRVISSRSKTKARHVTLVAAIFNVNTVKITIKHLSV